MKRTIGGILLVGTLALGLGACGSGGSAPTAAQLRHLAQTDKPGSSQAFQSCIETWLKHNVSTGQLDKMATELPETLLGGGDSTGYLLLAQANQACARSDS